VLLFGDEALFRGLSFRYGSPPPERIRHSG